MNIKISSIHFNADKKLLDHIEGKVSKLIQFSEEIISAEVYLRLDKAGNQENKVTKIKLDVPGYDLFAEKQATSFEEATDSVVDALRKQIKKRKEKLRSI
jgi:putative sigma-54 modulation protein